MKRFFLSVVLATTLALTSCQFDDSALWSKLDEYGESIRDHEQRISALEELCKQMNTNIEALQTLVNALEKRDYITNISPIREDGEVIGYTISFAYSDTITIYHGEDGKDGANGKDGYTPQIGVMKDTDGIYYWTLDGEWLLDGKGNKIQANGVNGTDGTNGSNGTNGVTPQLKIENDYWYVSYDNGATWEKLGKATGNDGIDGENGEDGDSIFKSVTQDDEYVYFNLADGTMITLPKGEKAEVVLENNKIYYTTTDGKKLFPYSTEPSVFGAILISNTYEDGQGILTFDDEVTTIGENAFASCERLASIVIPDGVTSLGDDAFYGCTGLVDITIGKGVNSIGERAFFNCTGELKIDSTIVETDYSSSSLSNENHWLHGSAFSKIIIGRNINKIGSYTFSDYASLAHIVLPSQISHIGAAAFASCTSLTRVDIFDLSAWCKIKFDGYTTNPLSHGAKFYINDTEITELLIPSDIVEIKDYSFYGCAIQTIVIPQSIARIGEFAFSNCTGNIVIDSKLIEDDYSSSVSFMYHSKFSSVTIGDNITKIGKRMFYGCKSLKNIILSKSLIEIHDMAFHGCTSLNAIYCTSATPPAIYYYYNYYFNHAMGTYQSEESVSLPYTKIYVPRDSYSLYTQFTSYKNGLYQTNWYKYKSYIEPYDFE